jgi:hypothetical protein
MYLNAVQLIYLDLTSGLAPLNCLGRNDEFSLCVTEFGHKKDLLLNRLTLISVPQKICEIRNTT